MSQNLEFSENETKFLMVKGCLKAHISFWELINASVYISKVIDEGYQFPLFLNPQNDNSAKFHNEFVTKAVLELLATKRIQETPSLS